MTWTKTLTVDGLCAEDQSLQRRYTRVTWLCARAPLQRATLGLSIFLHSVAGFVRPDASNSVFSRNFVVVTVLVMCSHLTAPSERATAVQDEGLSRKSRFARRAWDNFADNATLRLLPKTDVAFQAPFLNFLSAADNQHETQHTTSTLPDSESCEHQPRFTGNNPRVELASAHHRSH